jgi:hypothetical protein
MSKADGFYCGTNVRSDRVKAIAQPLIGGLFGGDKQQRLSG